jgi:chorismate mutase
VKVKITDREMALAELARLRRNIDEIDDVLVKLLNQRANWALEVGAAKRGVDLPIYEPEREAEVMRHVLAANRGPLSAEAIERLFERVIDESRSLQRHVIDGSPLS